MGHEVGRQTVGELAASDPAWLVAFDRLGVDYCCGGTATLEDACRGAGVDVDRMIATKREVPVKPGLCPPLMGAPIDEVIDHVLQAHHAFLHAEFPRLSQLVTKVRQVHGDRHPELVEVDEVFAALRADIEAHLMKEEQVLFTMCRTLVAGDSLPAFHCGSIANPIRVMLFEHDTAGDLLARLRRLTGDYQLPPDGCASYQAMLEGLARLQDDLHHHIHEENNILFPRVLELASQLT